ncbi:MAG: cation-translocating P-type ATPase [Pygmaiobacter massiliensis]|nr:cation-translocating P-type ATPase [Pygmaiobacter massiliensis]
MQNQSNGLSSALAKSRLEQNGPNELSGQPPKSAVGLFLSQFKDLMTIILAAATLLSALLGQTGDAVSILVIVLLNALMGFIQEYRTERTMQALAALSAPQATVVRDGRPQKLPASQLVVGDLVLLSAGDKIPADGRCLSPHMATADESLLTGESIAQAKRQGDLLYMGTSLVGGRCQLQITATGMQTEMGKIAGMLSSGGERRTPLQRQLDGLGRVVALCCIFICGLVSLIGLAAGQDPLSMLLTGISLSVAAIPEGLPAIVTIVLALSVGRILKKGALIRRLHAVETLGCTRVICSDKTGTITQNKMTVKQLWWPGGSAFPTGEGYAAGKLTQPGQTIPASAQPILRRLLQCAVLANDAQLEKKGKSYHVQGEPTETALLCAAAKGGVEKAQLPQTRLSERPFDPVRKRMSVTVATPAGPTLYCKGAPDLLLEHCDRIATATGSRPLTAADKAAVRQALADMAHNALRVLGFAEGVGEREDQLVFLGLAGMLDPPRPQVKSAVESCRQAGIKPVMITGDLPDTAAAIARQVGILQPGGQVYTGSQLEQMTDAQLAALCMQASVFARVSPTHKLRIVKAYQSLGQVVAMTGDGVNDAPAVQQADIGVAMGATGTDVTKEAAGVIILDDNFATIVHAVEEGRVIYQNIRRFVRYLLTCNLGEVLSMLFSLLWGAPAVLLPIQILMVNLLTDGLPAIALGMEPPSRSVMRKPPRPAGQSLFAEGLWAVILVRGVFLGLCTSGVFYYVWRGWQNLVLARSCAFLVLVLSQLVHLFECRGRLLGLAQNPFLPAACAGSALLCFAAVYLPAGQQLFSTCAVGGALAFPVAVGIFLGPCLFLVLRLVTRPLRRALAFSKKVSA